MITVYHTAHGTSLTSTLALPLPLFLIGGGWCRLLGRVGTRRPRPAWAAVIAQPGSSRRMRHAETGEMEPLIRTVVVVAPDHLAIRDVLAVTVARLVTAVSFALLQVSWGWGPRGRGRGLAKTKQDSRINVQAFGDLELGHLGRLLFDPEQACFLRTQRRVEGADMPIDLVVSYRHLLSLTLL